MLVFLINNSFWQFYCSAATIKTCTLSFIHRKTAKILYHVCERTGTKVGVWKTFGQQPNQIKSRLQSTNYRTLHDRLLVSCLPYLLYNPSQCPPPSLRDANQEEHTFGKNRTRKLFNTRKIPISFHSNVLLLVVILHVVGTELTPQYPHIPYSPHHSIVTVVLLSPRSTDTEEPRLFIANQWISQKHF